jgi:hypothetical protein
MQARKTVGPVTLARGLGATLLRREFLAAPQEQLEGEPVSREQAARPSVESQEEAMLPQVSPAPRAAPASQQEQLRAAVPRLSGFLLAKAPG